MGEFKFKSGDTVVIERAIDLEIQDYVGKTSVIIGRFKHPEGHNYYTLEGIEINILEGELELVNWNLAKEKRKFKPKDKVYITYGDFSGLTGVVEETSSKILYRVYIEESDYTGYFPADQLEVDTEDNVTPVKKEKDFVSIANEIGEFTQMKNEAYGSSVDATQKIMEVLMERYLNTETDKYEFPRSLLKHMLLQVRIMDKQNRLFSNPDGDKLGESAYRDLTGYGLIGIEMDERNS